MKIMYATEYAHPAAVSKCRHLQKRSIMFGTLNTQEIDEVLQQQSIGRIGCYADGRVYVVPISYGYDGEYIYCHTVEGMKLNMMRKNREICFQVDLMNDMANWRSVILWGTFEELENDDRIEALKILFNRELPMISSATARLTPEWPFAPRDMATVAGVVFRLRITDRSGRFERK